MPKEEKPLEYRQKIRNTKGIALGLDLNYLKRPETWLLWRKRLSWILPAAAIVISVPLVMGIGGGKKAFDNGPVSRAHAIFESRCEQCHAVAFTKVKDAACLKCHDGPAHPAKLIDTATLKSPPECAQCHVEHRGVTRLAEVSDANCTGCHGDLKARGDNVRLASVEITKFRPKRHPEFSSASRTDDRPLRLNHKKHMELLAKNYQGMKLPMKCSDCHATDPASPKGDLLPVKFDQNCRSCHQKELEFDIFHVLPQPMPAPHNKSVISIDAYINTTFRDAVTRNPGIMNKLLERDLDPMKDREAWIRRLSAKGHEYLFDPSRGKCMYCHQYQGDSDTFVRKTGLIRGQYAAGKPDGLPWLQRAEFSHRAHRAVECAECHKAAATSEKTTDVLIPRMENCTSCHGASGTPIDHCAQCHLYHNKEKETDKDRRPVNQLISNAPPPSPRLFYGDHF